MYTIRTNSKLNNNIEEYEESMPSEKNVFKKSLKKSDEFSTLYQQYISLSFRGGAKEQFYILTE